MKHPVFLTIVLLLAGLSACGPQQTWEEVNEQAKAAFTEERYEEAEALFRQALELSSRLPEDDDNRAVAENNLAQFYRAFDRLELALPHFETGLAWLVAHRPENHPEIAQSYLNIAIFYRLVGRFEAEVETYEKTLPILTANHGARSAQVADLLNNLAVARLSVGRHDDAREALETAMDIWQNDVLAGHPKIATNLTNLAMIQQEQLDFAGAVKSYGRAMEIIRSNNSEISPQIAGLWRSTGEAQRLAGNARAAADAFETS